MMIDQLLEFCGNHPLLVSGIVVAWLAVMVYEIRLKSQSFSHVSAAEAVRLMNAGAVVIDVRKPEEFAQGHIVSARNIEADALGNERKLLDKYKKKVVLTVCNSGLASNRAAMQLRREGIEQAFSIRGGLAAWKNENMPLEK
jgi:rhodanese-related sulfurtransferase